VIDWATLQHTLPIAMGMMYPDRRTSIKFDWSSLLTAIAVGIVSAGGATWATVQRLEVRIEERQVADQARYQDLKADLEKLRMVWQTHTADAAAMRERLASMEQQIKDHDRRDDYKYEKRR
jgi:uncharacterized membrane-anchored protein YhcB (DUF1043 family)